MKILRTGLSLILFLLLITPTILFAQFAGGSGTAEEPYLIATVQHLSNVRGFLYAHYRQINDIDLDIAPYNEGEGWVPIGLEDSFDGVYDGDGFTIFNMYMDRDDLFIGLFSRIELRGKVINLNLENVNITGNSGIGAITGINSGFILNSSAYGSVSGTYYAGSLAGLNYSSGYIAYCSGSCTISASEYAGGLIGSNSGKVINSFSSSSVSGSNYIGGLAAKNSGIIWSCYSTGLVTGEENTGGLIGYNSGDVLGSYWDTQASGQSSSTAGQGRTTEEMTFPHNENTYVDWDFQNIWGEEDEINNGYPFIKNRAPFIEGNGTVDNPYSVGNAEQLEGIRFHPKACFNQSNNIDLDVYPFNQIGWYPLCMKSGNSFFGLYNGNGYSIINLSVGNPNPSIAGLFAGAKAGSEIFNLGLENVSIAGDVAGGLIGKDGGCNIRNVSVTGNITGNAKVGGIVGEKSDGTMMKCEANISVYGNSCCGGLVGLNQATIDSSFCHGEVTGQGGLIGRHQLGSVSNSYSTCDIVSGGYLAGGLLGNDSHGAIINSYYNYDEVSINGEAGIISLGALGAGQYNQWINNGFFLDINDYLESEGEYYLIASSEDLKQLLGFGMRNEINYKLTNDIDVDDWDQFYIPYFAGVIDGQGYEITDFSINRVLGISVGFFGLLSESAIVYNLGFSGANVRGETDVGIIAGVNLGKIVKCHSDGEVSGISVVGGIAGSSNGGIISHCCNFALVNGVQYAGGIAGGIEGGSVYSSYNRGEISGDSFLGGFIGYNNGTVTNCYSTGLVSGFYETGGFIGFCGDSYILEHCYWDIETSGIPESGWGEGRTTEDMTYPYSDSTYVEWDFDSTWVADAGFVNDGYPYVSQDVISILQEKSVLPKTFSALTNHPNPFNPVTVIEFSLNERSMVNLSIYNIKGQLVKTLIDNKLLDVGQHTMRWDGKDSYSNNSASGVYFYRLENGDTVTTKKMLLLK